MAVAATYPRNLLARRTSAHITPENGPMYTVLVVEDERDIREVLRRYLEREGISVLTAGTGAEALHLIESIRPDLVLLDLGLPDIDGVEVLDAAAPAIPVVVLTARDAISDRINGLRHGADDYVIKPFSPTEVVLRVQAVLARGRRTASPELGSRSFGGGLLEVDEARHEARIEGQVLPLTPSEWGLLISMSTAPHRVFTRRELIERVSGYTFEGYERAIDSHVKNIRHKIGDRGHDVVETVVGFGYRFGLDPDG